MTFNPDEAKSVFMRKLQAKLNEISEERGRLGEFADYLKISSATVTAWKQGSGEPRASLLPGIAEFFEESMDWFVTKDDARSLSYQGMVERDFKGLRWLEMLPDALPHYLSDQQKEEVKVGIALFNTLVVQNKDRDVAFRTVQALYDYDIDAAYTAFLSALRTGAFRLIHVPRDEDLEEALVNAFGLRRDCVLVAKLPHNFDGTLIRTELVAFLAATKALIMPPPRANPPSKIGIGAGYTLLRMAELSVPEQFHNITWIPIVEYAEDADGHNPRSADHIALTLAQRNRSSTAMCMSSLGESAPDRTKRLNREWKSLNWAFLSVSGPGRSDRGYDPEDINQFRSADFKAFGTMHDIYLRLKDLGVSDDRIVGEILGRFLDDSGQLLGNEEIQNQMKEIARQIDFSILRGVRKGGRVWVVAARLYKARAVHLAIKLGLANGLVIDSEIAQYLLDTETQ